MNFEPGTVFVWKNYPYPRYGAEIKNRWFIYLGETGPFSQIAYVYISSTTTQVSKYDSYQSREKHSKFKFDVNNFPLFDEECVIDFFEKPYEIKREWFEKEKDNIEEKGKLRQDTMKMIYGSFQRAGVCSKIMLQDIRESFNRAEITGLSKR